MISGAENWEGSHWNENKIFFSGSVKYQSLFFGGIVPDVSAGNLCGPEDTGEWRKYAADAGKQ